ncbi:MAG: tRNA (mo5U34)-methyltransferase [Polaribacter sp.]|jgi:tRNA (mo5U34)-methyltransferase|tara:strand:+ start:349 stop:1338 length:990 start_codon:yes stop_codon:yes gene_type:complete
MLPSAINYHPFFDWLQNSDLESWHETLPALIEERLNGRRWGDMPGWLAALESLPDISVHHSDFNAGVTIGHTADITSKELDQLQQSLMGLHPWRKGPFELFGMAIDTEWRSDWKWERILPHLQSLQNRLILDVGCGNGYHCWRMLGAGASRVIGIDPSAKFIFQFNAIKKYAGAELPIDVLPLGIEHMPTKMAAFDTVFSMGILYHRRSPMDHLRELRELLRPGGQLVLETLVIDGPEGQVLVPEGRYGKMPNVWFLPSPDTLVSWLRKQGFVNPRVVDISPTSIEEQRSTDWMTYDSLADFLDPTDMTKTAEGHPAPIRAVVIAEVPF